MQAISRRKIAQYASRELMSGVPASKVFARVAAYLVDTKQQSKTELLVRDIKTILSKEYGVVLAEVTSARSLSDSTISNIKQFIKLSQNAKQVEVDTSIDPDLIGGVIIRTPTSELDATVRKQLNSLRS